jgi:hypothetical protein
MTVRVLGPLVAVVCFCAGYLRVVLFGRPR